MQTKGGGLVVQLTVGTGVLVDGGRVAEIAIDNENGTFDVIYHDDDSEQDGVHGHRLSPCDMQRARPAPTDPVADKAAALRLHAEEKDQRGRATREVPGPKPPGHTRFVCISDTHGLHDQIEHIPDGDVLLHAGDFTNTGELEVVQSFSCWLDTLKGRFEHIVVIAGNHEATFEPDYYERSWRTHHGARPEGKYDSAACRAALKNCTYLEGEAAELRMRNGSTYHIFGSPYQVRVHVGLLGGGSQ